jgi:hypothetical protein
MNTAYRKNLILTLICLPVALGLLFSSGITIPPVDTATDAYFDEAIRSAGVAYATCRVLNASVSVIKESELQLEPAGVGVSLAIGQILDPIDDMTERLSDVLVTAITSLGVQKLTHLIGCSLAPPLLAGVLLLLCVFLWLPGRWGLPARRILLQIGLLVIIARFCLPLAAGVNTFLQRHFFDNRIAAARHQLELGSAELDRLKEFDLPESDGIIGTIDNSAAFIKQKSMELKDALVTTISNTGTIVDNLLKLTFLYVAVFVIQVILLPLGVFWFLLKLSNAVLFQGVVTTPPPGAGQVAGTLANK